MVFQGKPPAAASRADDTLSLADERLARLVRDTRQALLRALQSGLGEHGVLASHWTLLRILWVRDGFNQRELSELAGVREPTIFASLKAMETLGYVTRRRLNGNRKNMHIYLTGEGRALRDVLLPVAIAANERAVRGVSPADIAATRRTLLAMMSNLSEEARESVPSNSKNALAAGDSIF